MNAAKHMFMTVGKWLATALKQLFTKDCCR
jgi:hypothetical protein